jgi:hypothetical protein
MHYQIIAGAKKRKKQKGLTKNKPGRRKVKVVRNITSFPLTEFSDTCCRYLVFEEWEEFF